MSQHKVALALGFLEMQPKAAAAIIELQGAQAAADFMAAIPASKASKVVAKMMPPFAAQLCLLLPKDAATSILIQLDAKVVVHILRLLPAAERDFFLKELPAKAQVACILMLSYSEAMVGAWITPHVLTIPDSSNVSEALGRVEATMLPVTGDSVFVVDREQQLKGRVRLMDLLQATKELPINAITQLGIETMNGRMPVHEAAQSSLWEINEEIPVLNRRKEFIGVLRHADLRRALRALSELSPEFKESPDLLTGISQGYGQTLLALMQSMQEFVKSELHPKSQ